MIPNEEQLATIARMRDGSLAEIPYAVLLHALAVHRRSVVLRIERVPLEKSIIFEEGTPVDCRSNLLNDTLSRFMIARGDLTEEVSQRCFKKSFERGLQFGEVLILEGLITASELYRVLQQSLAKKLLDGFSWRTGEFRIREGLPKVESPLKVNTPQLVVTGIAKFALDDEVNAAVGPLVGKALYLHPSPPFPLGDIRLTRDQRSLTELLRGGKRIDELAAETKIPFNDIMRLLYSLAVIGIVVPEEWMPQEAAAVEEAAGEYDTATLPLVELDEGAPEPAESAASAATPAEPAVAPPPDFEQERDALMEAFLRHRKQDAFELLDVAEEATMLEIERGYVAFSERCAPWRFDVPGQPGLVEKAEALFLAGGRAFGELCDPERRNALIARRHRLREEGARRPARDRFMIKSDLLDSEVQFKKGKALMRAGKYREAVRQLEFAYDCDPQNSTYRAELAHCRFLDAPEARGRSSLEELAEILRIDPGCGLAVYYTGVVHGEQGELDEAERYLRASIKMLMPDRRPIEALKEIQARKKRKRRLF